MVKSLGESGGVSPRANGGIYYEAGRSRSVPVAAHRPCRPRQEATIKQGSRAARGASNCRMREGGGREGGRSVRDRKVDDALPVQVHQLLSSATTEKAAAIGISRTFYANVR